MGIKAPWDCIRAQQKSPGSLAPNELPSSVPASRYLTPNDLSGRWKELGVPIRMLDKALWQASVER